MKRACPENCKTQVVAWMLPLICFGQWFSLLVSLCLSQGVISEYNSNIVKAPCPLDVAWALNVIVQGLGIRVIIGALYLENIS